MDRNIDSVEFVNNVTWSPSTRRAWIEIFFWREVLEMPRSPSTRRAWIEIVDFNKLKASGIVALHPEGVDRN